MGEFLNIRELKSQLKLLENKLMFNFANWSKYLATGK